MTSQDPIKELKTLGVYYDKYKQETEEYYFKCDVSPYKDDEKMKRVRELISELGNCWAWHPPHTFVVGKFRTITNS